MVSRDELAVLTAARPDVPLRVLPVPGAPSKAWIVAAPCPFLTEDGRCDVYPVRPYNCRRYLCGREDPWREPYDRAPVPARVLQSRALRRLYARTQREAQRWADQHGWKADD